MKEIIVSQNDSGQRFDKLLFKILNKAPSSFVYKMLRKKNITLNGKKASGKELICTKDVINIYLSDDTFHKFSGLNENKEKYISDSDKNSFKISKDTICMDKEDILYEDEHILLYHKRAGLLSQRSKVTDISVNDLLNEYLSRNGNADSTDISGLYKPSCINRLDRNTEGIIICAKTYVAAKELSLALKERTLDKYYTCIVKGVVYKEELIEGRLVKNEVDNKVTILSLDAKQGEVIKTYYSPVYNNGEYTMLKVKLMTGKSHQIRAHLAYISHPILGDNKYGSKKDNEILRKSFGINHQLLFSQKIVMPQLKGDLSYLSGKEFELDVPKIYKEIMGSGNLEFKRS